jgi:hypothetical protein
MGFYYEISNNNGIIILENFVMAKNVIVRNGFLNALWTSDEKTQKPIDLISLDRRRHLVIIDVIF